MAVLNMGFDKWDKSLPFIEAVIKYAEENMGHLEDHVFTEMIEHYELEEQEAMLQMMDCKKVSIGRGDDGFNVNL